ncbi:MAG TPA: NACHT domain-containing protein [Pyrinomonadaceae bacterium]|jgi:hypothetical protein
MDHHLIATTVGAWLWQTYGKSITGKTLGAVRSKWEHFNWGRASEKYRERVKQLYGTMRILGMAEPVSLEGIYTDVFILDKPTAFKRYDIKHLVRESTERDRLIRAFEGRKRRKKVVTTVVKPAEQSDLDPDVIRREALSVINEQSKLFILGKPGAGKTTLLKYIALQAASNKLDKIPIFISLREYADAQMDLMSFIVRQFEICAFPDARLFIEHLLQEGQSIILFDGLDEINQERDERTLLVNSLKRLIHQYPNNQYLITCRIAATDYSFENFTYVEIADFDNKQIHIFVSKWFQNKTRKGDKFLEELNDAENKGLRELASIPLLLVLLCLAFEETLTFPARRVEIYEEAIEALLKKWDTSRNIKRDSIYRKLSLGRKRQMLARIAAEAFESGAYFLRQDELEKLISNYLQTLPTVDASEDIEAETILKSVEAQHGLLVERAWRIYSFSHLTFQEYFTAKYISDNASGGTLRGLMEHATDSRWREIFLISASLLDDADEFFTLFIHSINKIIYDDEVIKSLFTWVKETMESSNAMVNYPIRAMALDRDIEHVFEANQDNITTYAQDIGYARACAINLALNAGTYRAFLIILALDFALSLEFACSLKEFNFPSGRHTISTGSTTCFAHALTLSRHLGMSDLYEELSSLPIPSGKYWGEGWATFIESLQSTIEGALGLEQIFYLMEERLKLIIKYLESNILLIECLNLACVSDRSKIVNSLLLVP